MSFRFQMMKNILETINKSCLTHIFLPFCFHIWIFLQKETKTCFMQNCPSLPRHDESTGGQLIRDGIALSWNICKWHTFQVVETIVCKTKEIRNIAVVSLNILQIRKQKTYAFKVMKKGKKSVILEIKYELKRLRHT